MEAKADAAFFEKVYRGFKARPPGTTPYRRYLPT